MVGVNYLGRSAKIIVAHHTVPIGKYPEVSLAVARERCADARKVLRSGVDPNPSKREMRARAAQEAGQTFEEVGRQWLAKMAHARSASTQEKVSAWLENDIFPYVGAMAAPSNSAASV